MMQFNDDAFIAEEFLKLKLDWSITTVIETGSNEGETSTWLTNNFENAHTIEIVPNQKLFEVGRNNPKLNIHYGSSDDVLATLIPTIENRILFYLDAHWNHHWPLLNELAMIASCRVKPIIAIHDFKCYDLGYDSYEHDLNFEYVRRSMEKIYSDVGFLHYTNLPEKSTGARRGIGYFIPQRR